jgi:hypothetical protein
VLIYVLFHEGSPTFSLLGKGKAKVLVSNDLNAQMSKMRERKMKEIKRAGR